ncbi:MAG: DUF5686 family protein [Candidatus Azobacteroides sp.]|nr:DUF5686 family protein [Candidatus Azobacteroides sp.]
MQIQLLFIFSFILCIFSGNAQQTPSEIKYKAWDIHALRYYPFTQPADSFVKQVIDRKPVSFEKNTANRYEKIAVDLAMNKQFLADEINSSTSLNLIFKQVLLPYNAWLDYARPVREDSPYLNLTLFLSERESKENRQTRFYAQSPLNMVEAENIRYYLEEWLGKVDLWKERSDVLFSSVKSPLAKDAGKIYRYFFSSRTEIAGIPVYEIAFFSQELNEKAFEGYLYISVNDLSPVKAVFTLNPLMRKGPARTVLFIQTPAKKETLLIIGNDITTGLLVEQVRIRENETQDSIALSPAQKEFAGFMKEAENTRAFSNLQNGLSLLLTDHIGIFRDHFDLGPISQMFSYNYMEGIRLRIGGFTSQEIGTRAAAGGYLAYGTKDERWKYRGDILFMPRSTERFQLTYVNDLNIPGRDCLDDKRDDIFYSFYQRRTTNMSLQKIGQLSYEADLLRRFSLKLNVKYMYDQPVGIVNYQTVNNGLQTTINDITTGEIGVSFRFAPNERYLRIKGKRIVFRFPDMDFRLHHRIGVKGIFGSDYSYQITDLSLSKFFDLPSNAGLFNLRLSGGKVWNSVPFPLLFIPAGNQTYIFDTNYYNLMRLYEFTTDRFVAGNADFQLNWSPLKILFPQNKMKTHWGIKAIYGPLSDKNNPQLHPELFILNNGVEALGEKPYAEAHIGLSGIFKYFRVDYVHRLTYGTRDSLFGSLALGF